MAGRVNTRFVVLLASVIVLIVLAVAGVYVLKVMRSAEELIRQGDVYLAQDQPRMAIEKFGRAIAKRPDDVELLQKYAATLRTIDVKDIVEARSYLGQIQSATRQATEADPANPKLLEDYYELQLSLARRFGGHGAYDELYRLTSIKLEQYPDNLTARKYRGIAQANRLSFNMPRAEQLQASEDLLKVYEARPEDAQVAHALAQWSLFEADRLDHTAGSPQEIQKLLDNAVALSEQMLAQDPDDLQRQLFHLQTLLDPQVQRTDEAAPLADRIEADLLEDARPDYAVMALVEALPRVDAQVVHREGRRDTTRGVQRAQRLLEAAVRQQPERVLFHTILGRVYAMQGDNQAAIEQFATAWGLGFSAPPIEALQAYNLRLAAGLGEMNLRLGTLDSLDASAREALLGKVTARLEQVEKIAGESGMTHLLRGKLALVRREFAQAMQSLDKAAEMLAGGRSEIEALMLSARARRLSGERGAAARQLEKLVQRIPGAVAVRLELAELRLQMKQYDQAQALIEPVLAADGDNPQALMLSGQLLAQMGRVDDAIAAYRELDLASHPQVLVPLAQLYAARGEQDKARGLVRRRFEQTPQDVRVLSLMLGIIDDKREKLQLIAQSRAAGGDPTVLDLLQRQVESGEPLTRQELVGELIDQQDDPMLKELTQAKLHLRRGEIDPARAALERAAEINADHPQVIEMQFELALSQSQWDQAGRLAARAGSLNLDLAGGAFFRGQLAATQGHMEEAVAEYRRGLSARPIYSEGWRRMGDAQAQLHNTEAAADAYERALDQRPDNTRAIRGLAGIADARGDHAKALSLLKSALRYNPNDPQMLETYLAYEQRHGDPADALRLREQLAKANPGNADNRRALAVLLAQQGKIDQAVAAADALLADHGQTLGNVQTAAAVQAIAGNIDAGREMLKSYIASRGEQVTAEDWVALARFNLAADDARALDAYAKARQLEDPQTRPVTRELADLLFARGATEQALPLYRELHEQSPDDAVVGLRYAEALVRAGEAEKARQVLDQYPGKASGQVLQAALAMREEDRAGAIQALERGLQIEPRNVLARVQLASLLMDDPAQSVRARDLLTEALRIAPDSAQARLAMATLHQRQGEVPEAIRELRTVLTDHPDNNAVRLRLVDLYMGRREFNAADALLRDAAAREPDNAAWPRLRSRLAAGRGDLSAAIDQARKALELDPSAQSLGALASVLIRADQAAEALAALDEQPGMVNAEPGLQGIRGVALAKTGHADQARRVLGLSIQRAQSLSQALALAGQAAEALGIGPAIELLTTMDPSAHPRWVQIAAAQLQLQDGRFDQAIEQLRALREHGESDAPAETVMLRRMLAVALYQDGQFEAAQQAYQQLLTLRPDDVATLNNLAYLLVEDLGETEKGLAMARRAAALQPDNAQVLDTLGWAQFKAGKVDQARETLERSVGIQPLAPSCYHLARVYAGLGVTGPARRHVQQAIDLATRSGDQAVLGRAQALLKELGS